jgi:hypothetical protein
VIDQPLQRTGEPSAFVTTFGFIAIEADSIVQIERSSPNPCTYPRRLDLASSTR